MTKGKEHIEDNITWTKCSEVETPEEDQQVFKIKREDILVVKIEESFCPQ